LLALQAEEIKEYKATLSSDQQQQQPSYLEPIIQSNRQMMKKELFLRLTELGNAYSIDNNEKYKFIKLSTELLDALESVDAALHTNVVADIKKELDSESFKEKGSQKSKDIETAQIFDQVIYNSCINTYSHPYQHICT
jgi:hypothetical protein